MFDKDFTKIKELLETVENLVEANHPQLCLHLQQESDLEIKDIYFQTVLTFFIADLQHVSPQIAMNIFDVFLIEGETVLFLLISRFIAYKEDHLMNLEEPEL